MYFQFSHPILPGFFNLIKARMCVACWGDVKNQWCKIACVYITTQNS